MNRTISNTTSCAPIGTAKRQPSVEAPVGDFFGVGFGLTEKYSSALFAIDARRGKLTDPAASGAARNCYIPMPFKRSARLTITNLGKKPSTALVRGQLPQLSPSAPKDQGYFHAQYRQGTPPPVGPYTILEATGRGPSARLRAERQEQRRRLVG